MVIEVEGSEVQGSGLRVDFVSRSWFFVLSSLLRVFVWGTWFFIICRSLGFGFCPQIIFSLAKNAKVARIKAFVFVVVIAVRRPTLSTAYSGETR